MKLPAVHHPRKFLGVAALLLADGIVFGGTDAVKVTSFMLIIGFALLMATFYCLVHGLLALAGLYGLAIRQKRRLAGSLTGLMACVVALQSVGELNLRDVLLLLPLVVIAYIYSSYASTARDSDV